MLGVSRSHGGDQIYPKNRPLTRVELHVHLDGSLRHETIWELSKEKNLQLPGKGTLRELQDYLVCKKPENLGSFLSRFDVILACIKGDLKALERISYEFVEDCANSGVVYSEARYCPHLIIEDSVLNRQKETGDKTETKKWTWDITGAIIKGLIRGEQEFGTKVNLIATSIRGMPPFWFDETIELVADSGFHGGRIIGIDIAGVASTADEKHMFENEAIELFDKAKKLGIGRTVHAAESGPAEQVTFALDKLHADRIGHGYRICFDQNVYKRVKQEKVHLECCPWSSLLTGSISPFEIPHPVVKFFADDFNVSINTDDPTVTGTHMDNEYQLLGKWGLCEAHFIKGSFNAARSCFLPENEKADLIQRLSRTYGCLV